MSCDRPIHVVIAPLTQEWVDYFNREKESN
jgi:hypothetical protein